MNEGMQATDELWKDFQVIHAYTRREALADGVLVDVTDWAREAGFKFPVAVTRAVWNVLEPSENLKARGEDVAGRAWDLFTVLKYAIKGAARTDEVHFAPLFALDPGEKVEQVQMWASCAPGDDGAPVITVMMEGED